jgi:geranylgeranyl pyrophosphate synthase
MNMRFLRLPARTLARASRRYAAAFGAWEDAPTVYVAECPPEPYDIAAALSAAPLELSPRCSAALASAADPHAMVEAEIVDITSGIMGLMGRNRAIVSFVEARFAQRRATNATLRPTLALLMADAVGSHVRGGEFGGDDDGRSESDVAARRAEREDVRRIASIAEMLHMATRLHGEVTTTAPRPVDEAAPLSVSASGQDKLAILAGDFLLARASVFLSRIRRVEIVEMLASVLEHLVVAGVDRSPAVPRDARDAVRANGQRAFYRTASLTAHSCLAAAIVGSGADARSGDELASQTRAWSAAATFGENLGLVLHLQREAAASEAAGLSCEGGLGALLDELAGGEGGTGGGVAAVRRLARVHANRGMEALVDGLHPSPSRDALLRLANAAASTE